jgi:hypothetical protein
MCAAICAAAGYLTANHERDVYVTLWGTCGAITGAVVGKNWHVLGAALIWLNPVKWAIPFLRGQRMGISS